MAERIYDQTMGQLAGVEVTTTGNSTPTRNGLEAYAQMVVSASGQPISSTEGSGNLVDLSGATVAAGSLSFSANNQYAIIDTQGFEGASFTVSGFGTATLAVQWSNLAASGFIAGLVTTVGTTTTSATITADGQYTASSGGRYMKVATTAYTSGTLVVTPVLLAGSSVASSGGGGAGGVVQGAVTTAAPTYTNGTDNDLSLDLKGGLRTLVQDAAGAAVDWTAPVATFGTGTAGSPGSGTGTSTTGVLTIQGPTASDSAIAATPVTTGGRAVSTALPTAVSAAGDVVNDAVDLYGRQISPAVLRALKGSQFTTITASTAKTTIVTADAANLLDLYGLVLANSSASATTVLIEDDTTARMEFLVPAGETRGFMLPSDSGLKQAAVNKNWSATCGTSVTSLFVTALYVKDA